MRLRKRLLSLALSLVLVLPITLLLSPAPAVSAQTISTLYGTGSADEINIVKLLDMALNKGGMSMSPATIKAFLEFWWSSVQADLNTCISNADAAIATTQDFVDYVYTALEDAEHYDQLGDIIKRYVRYVLTLDAKSLADFKQLLTQEGTFRQFLLSYVTDQDGNIAGTVDNKLVKYNIGKEFVNMVRQAADCYIEEYEGYYLVPTLTYKDLSPSQFGNKDNYNTTVDFLKNRLSDSMVFLRYLSSSIDMVFSIDGLAAVNTSYSAVGDGRFEVVFYNSNWNTAYPAYWSYSDDSNYPLADYPDNFGLYTTYTKRYSLNFQINGVTCYPVFSSDGRALKIWKSLDAFKAASVGKSNIYYSADYSKYDSSVDNSIEFSGSYYSSNSSSYSHDIIQNTIDNSSEVNESTINNIVNNYITNNYGDGSGTGSGTGSGSGDDWWNIGDGITSFVKGVAALLDFLLKLLGDLIGVISDFLIGLLEVLKRLGDVGLSFGDFLKTFFGFLPGEIIDLMVVGIGAVVVVGVIKAFKR